MHVIGLGVYVHTDIGMEEYVYILTFYMYNVCMYVCM